MRLFITPFIAMMIVCACTYAQQSAFSQKYIPSFSSGTIKKYIKDMEHQTRVLVSYSATYVDVKRTVQLPKAETTLYDALTSMLDGQNLSLEESNGKILILSAAGNKQNTSGRVVINGYVKELQSKEVLIGAIVYVPALGIGTTTNSYGFYSLTLPAGNHRVVCTYIGYVPDSFYTDKVNNGRYDVLVKLQGELKEVDVVSDKETSPDHVHLTTSDIKSRPAILGENDVMRALQHIPGVQSGTDGTNAIMVRGGDPGQNLNMLDGVPLYYVDHFFGLTSIYNSEAIRSVDFHKGAFPSRYGGRLSSVIDVNTKDGDMQSWGGQFTMGIVKSSLSVEGPLKKDKASIMLSGRRTWFDLFWRPFTDDLIVNFYDVNAKVNYIINKNNRVYLSFYNGRDGIGANILGSGTQARWGNTLGSAKWNTVVNPKLFVNTILTYSRFNYTIEDSRQIIDNNSVSNSGKYKGKSSINEVALRIRAHWYATATQHIEFGGHISNAQFIPTELLSFNNQNVYTTTVVPADKFQSNEVTFFVEDEIKLTDKWMIRPGIHLANWFSERFNYSSVQPRFYTNYAFTSKHNVYGSFTSMAQFLHLISNNTYGLPTDFWLPSSARIEPEEAMLYTVGYAAKPAKRFSFNIEGYYKTLKNNIAYNMGKNLFDNSLQWDEKIIQGTGWSYGGEVSTKWGFGNFTWTTAYTLSWTWRKFAQLNQGLAFPYRFDRRHNIRTSLLYRPSQKMDVAASWTYMSGEAITLPDQIYPDLDNNLYISPSPITSSSNYTYNYVKWNNYRLPAIHRLDIGANFTKKRKRAERTWSLGVFNLYGRPNVMFVELVSENAQGSFKLKGISVLQFIPYIAYKINF